MDRPRSDLPHPLWVKFKRGGLAAIALCGVVFGVAAIPPLVLTFWVDTEDLRPAARAAFTGTTRVHFRSGSTSLSGILTLPSGTGPHPGIVVVHGSGRQTADDYRSVSSFFSANGYAVLAYDKRGTGRSEGTYNSVGVGNSDVILGELAGDAAEALNFLRDRAEVDPDRLGYLGFSQAGWIVPQAVAQTPWAAFAVLFSGPAVSVGQEIFYSYLTGDDFGRTSDLSDSEINAQLKSFDGPHGFDPRQFLENMSIPSLWLLGERDRSIPVPETVEILHTLIESHQRPFSVHLFPNTDHSLRNTGTGRRADAFPVALKWLQETGR